jgi:hypothetical protein
VRPYLEKNPSQKNDWWSDTRCRPRPQVLVPKKKKKKKKKKNERKDLEKFRKVEKEITDSLTVSNRIVIKVVGQENATDLCFSTHVH